MHWAVESLHTRLTIGERAFAAAKAKHVEASGAAPDPFPFSTSTCESCSYFTNDLARPVWQKHPNSARRIAPLSSSTLNRRKCRGCIASARRLRDGPTGRPILAPQEVSIKRNKTDRQRYDESRRLQQNVGRLRSRRGGEFTHVSLENRKSIRPLAIALVVIKGEILCRIFLPSFYRLNGFFYGSLLTGADGRTDGIYVCIPRPIFLGHTHSLTHSRLACPS